MPISILLHRYMKHDCACAPRFQNIFYPPEPSIDSSLGVAWFLSFFLYLKNRTSQCVQQLSRNKVIIIVVVVVVVVVVLFLLLVVTVWHWLPCCVSRLCPLLPCEHHDSCCKQSRIDSFQIPTYLPFIIGSSSNLMLLCLFIFFFWSRIFK